MSQAQRDKTHDFTQMWDLKIGDLIKTESSKNRGEQGESGQSARVARGRSCQVLLYNRMTAVTGYNRKDY